jgi:5-formyltetrahydrofolate cyclo-ligase
MGINLAMTTDQVSAEKHALRLRLRRARSRLTPGDQLLAGLTLQRRLLSLSPLHRPGLLAGTLPHRGEIDARPFLEQWLRSGYPLALPRIDPASGEIELRRVNDLKQTAPGFRGILEPDPSTSEQISPGAVSFLLIPGLAFDPLGSRLGQGGGHYDRFLERLGDEPLRIGIAHDFQILPRIPHVPGLDHPMDFVVSPHRVLHCRRAWGRLAPC